MTSTVLVEVRGNVQIMTLSNPEARNAATLEMAEAMAAALDELDRNPALQVGVITGAGGTFCAGMDLKGFLQGKRPTIPGRGFCGITIKPPRKPVIALCALMNTAGLGTTPVAGLSRMTQHSFVFRPKTNSPNQNTIDAVMDCCLRGVLLRTLCKALHKACRSDQPPNGDGCGCITAR